MRCKPLEDITKKLKEVYGDKVKIIEKTYLGVRKNATFVNSEGREWTTRVDHVLRGNSRGVKTAKREEKIINGKKHAYCDFCKTLHEINKKFWILNYKFGRGITCRKKNTAYRKNFFEKNQIYASSSKLRILIWKIVKRRIKTDEKVYDILGCTKKKFVRHIEKQFQSGMSWSNHGIWHIDHICPLSQARNEYEIKLLCNFRNLRPLFKKENLIKNDNPTPEAVSFCEKLLNRKWDFIK